MAAALLAAVLVPLLGAVVALAVPSPDRPRRRPSRRGEPAPEGASSDEGADEGDEAMSGRRRRGVGRRSRRRSRRGRDEAGVSGGGPAAAPPPDPAAVEQAAARARVTVRGAALMAAGLWVAVTLVGHVTAGPFTASGPVGPAGVGAALLLASVRRPARHRSAVGGATALSLLTGGLAVAAGTGSLLVAAALLVAGSGVIAVTSRGDGEGAAAGLVALAGMMVVAAGLARLAATQPASAFLTAPGTGGVLLPAELPGQATAALLGTGAVVVAVAGALRARSVAAPLLPVGLALGIPAVAALGPGGDAVAFVLGVTAVSVAGAWAAQSSDGLRLLVVSVALLALAAAAADTAVPAGLPSGGLPAAWLLAASAVVTAVVLTPLAALSAVPGAAALTAVLVADPQPVRLALVALVVIVATLTALAVASGRDEAWVRPRSAAVGEDDPGPVLAGAPAAAVGAWLVLAPGTWAWTGAPALDGWSESLAVALAGGLVAAVAGAAAGRVAIPDLPRLVGPDPEPAEWVGWAPARQPPAAAPGGRTSGDGALLASRQRSP